MATLHLIVGLPCSGKTTLARQLETKYSALRLTTDEWHIRLFGHDFGDTMTESEEAEHDSRHESVESLMWDMAARVLVPGVDVILDFGCWVRSQRDEFRSRAENLGADCNLHFADAPAEVLLERLKARNEMQAEGTFFIPEAKLKQWIEIFEHLHQRNLIRLPIEASQNGVLRVGDKPSSLDPRLHSPSSVAANFPPPGRLRWRGATRSKALVHLDTQTARASGHESLVA